MAELNKLVRTVLYSLVSPFNKRALVFFLRINFTNLNWEKLIAHRLSNKNHMIYTSTIRLAHKIHIALRAKIPRKDPIAKLLTFTRQQNIPSSFQDEGLVYYLRDSHLIK